MSRTSASHDDSGTAELRDSAQRRQVTVLFADMAGFTPLAEQLGEEKTYHVMQRVHRELSEAEHGARPKSRSDFFIHLIDAHMIPLR